MVETQQGISTFLSFGAKSVKPEILEELLIGRREDIDYLTKCVKEITQDGLNNQIIVVGQRGMGKTHLLRVLYQRSQVFLNEDTLKIAYFSEEEYGISGYLDFLIRVLNAFVRWHEEDKEALNAQMDVLREIHPNRQIDFAEQIIAEYIADKPLLILAENFNDILEALGKDGQGKLRSFMYRYPRTSIIATSQALSPDLGREDRPFYNFFTTFYLKKLTYEDSLALLRQLADMEQQTNVIEHLKGKGIAQVRAVHELVKGNHRLLVTFYEFLKADTLATLSKIFIKTLNDLKPYYETFIRYLPPQQQKILHYIALSKIPQNGTEISKNCFIDPKSLSKQLSELGRKNLIDAIPDPDDNRNKLYDVSEPLLRISIEIGEHKEGISALFIDFLALYYSFDELQAQKERFEDIYANEIDFQVKQDLWHDIQAREKAMEFQIQNLVIEQKRIFENMISQYDKGDFASFIETVKKVSNDNKNSSYYFILGLAYQGLKEYQKSIECYENAIVMEPEFHDAIYCLANLYFKVKDYSKAISYYLKIVEIHQDTWEVWHNLGFVYSLNQNYTMAIEMYSKALVLKPNEPDIWNNIGITYSQSKNFRQAIRAFQNTIEIKPNHDKSWYNLGNTYFELKEYNKAILAYQRATEIEPSEHSFWNNLGVVYEEIRDYLKAAEAYQKAIETGGIYIKNQNGISKNEVFGAISEMSNFILQHDLNLNITQVQNLESIIENDYKLPDELMISHKYLQTFRRYVLENDKKALLELPKEQRIFFEREILAKRKSNLNS